MTPGETVLTIALYIASGWIALMAIYRFQEWRDTRNNHTLGTALVYALGATVAIAYLVWWPLLLVLTWQFMEWYRARRQP